MSAFIKNSLLAGNGAIQTFLEDGVNINAQPIAKYIAFETASIAANTTKIFNLKDKDWTLTLNAIWFTPSVANSNLTLAVRSGATNIYSLSVSTASNAFELPLIIIKSGYDLAIITPAGLTLTNVLIVAQQVYLNDSIIS